MSTAPKYRNALVIVFIVFGMCFTRMPSMGQTLITGLDDRKAFDSLVLSISTPLYNLNFEETTKRIDQLKELLPDHPVIDLLYAINYSWETLPEALPDNFDSIESHLKRSLEKANQWLEVDPDNPEATFFLLMSHGLLAQYYNSQGSPFRTISEAKRAYHHIIEGFEMKSSYNEFLFSCGLYNYYRERYPQLFPVYRPFIWLFRSGSVEAGLQQLDSARKVTVLSRVEASHYLAYIYLRYEQQPRKAINIMVPLVVEFPGNLYFKTLLLEAYMMIGNLDQVTDMIHPLIASDLDYYKMCGNTFEGVLYEKYKFDDKMAGSYYNTTLKLSENYSTKDINAISVAYAGLARISARANDIRRAKEYYKLAAKYAQSEPIRKEAKQYLKDN